MIKRFALTSLLLGPLILQSQTPGAPDWHSEKGGRWKTLSVPAQGRTGFALLPPETTGISFSNHLSDLAAATNRVLQNGSGVALGDVDGDGWCDLYFCRIEGPNQLYRNLGQGKFADVTEAAGIACARQFSTGAALADLDGDGDLDLLVNSIGHGTREFLNDGAGHFTEVEGSRLVRRFGSTSMALADIDSDGDLDLYVTNYRTETHKDIFGFKREAQMVGGKIVITPADRFVALGVRSGGVEVVEKGERDFLYINDGKGRFAPVSWTAGSFLDANGKPLEGPPTDWGLSVMFRDLNGDGLPDIYICNDFFYWRDRVWINEQGQRFREMSPLALRSMSMSSMAVDVADINRDGWDDIFVAEMLNRDHQARQRHRENVIKKSWELPITDPQFALEVPRNTLQLNRGDGTYAEIAQFSGIDASEWTWSAIFLDVDLDGYEDLLMTTGHHYDVQDTDTLRALAQTRAPDTIDTRIANLRKFPRLDTPSLAFRNQRDLTFAEAGAAWGFNHAGVAHGMALADLDQDGDLEMVVNNLNAPAGIYRNESTTPRVAVRLKGRAPNTAGVGAQIRLYGGAVNLQSQEMISGGRYLSCDEAVRVFAAGTLTNQMRLEIRWRSGRQTVVEGVRANRLYEVFEEGSSMSAPARPAVPPPFFRDVSELLAHRHVDPPFDDYSRQTLLPKKLSQLGPGVAWSDFNGDGWEDLGIGMGQGEGATFYLNNGKGGFTRATAKPPGAKRDLAGLVVWPEKNGRTVVLAAAANYEDGAASGAGVERYDPVSGAAVGEWPAGTNSPGPLAVADLTGNGGWSLFVGGRVVPGRYPEAASSQLLRRSGDRWSVDPKNSQALSKIGLVSGAVWTDLDGDGLPELVAACEWGPIRVWRNRGGQLSEATADFGLARYVGWWNGVTSGDFDGDGRMDLVASNWGRNHKYQRYLAQPLRLYFGDFNRNGGVETIEAFFDPVLKKIVPWRDVTAISSALRVFPPQLATCQAFGQAGVAEILGDSFARAGSLEANTLDSMVFLNRGGRFEAAALPVEAQFAPAFAVCVGDYDGDGKEDIFLSQNFFEVEVETSRYDAGRGLWLRGDGQGRFAAVSGEASGIKVYGSQRGAALCDYDHDGRVDLVVAQNNGETKLYHNERGTPGLRVRVSGGATDPNGIGAVIWMEGPGGRSAAREIHAGSGYWSQDGAVQVLAKPLGMGKLSVRWPGGNVTVSAVPEGALECAVDSAGNLKVLRP